jgi:hypothetical protein
MCSRLWASSNGAAEDTDRHICTPRQSARATFLTVSLVPCGVFAAFLARAGTVPKGQ